MNTDGTTEDREPAPPTTAGAVTVDADGREIPVDLAAWIDDRDPDPPVPADDASDGTGVAAGGTDDASDGTDPRAEGDVTAETTSEAADRALGEQRAVHEPDDRDANDALGELVNNTGDDGGAASG